MPEKDPSFWSAAFEWLNSLSPQLYALALSATVAVARVIYGGGTRSQAFWEAVLCGLGTLMLVPLLAWMKLPESMATFIGGMLGFLGVEKFRGYLDRFASKKLDK